MEAIVVQITANQITVQRGNARHRVFAPGKWKAQNVVLRPGDRVLLASAGDGYQIARLRERKNVLERPKIANVDNLIVVQSRSRPDMNWAQLLKTIAFYESALGIVPTVAITKLDLEPLDETDASRLADLRRQSYPIVPVPGPLDALREALKDKVSVFVGPSGAGKSTLINALDPGLNAKTGAVSERLGRGKNTTTQTRLLSFAGGFLADTPGYSRFQTPLPPSELSAAFHAYSALKPRCRFFDCLHLGESGCAVAEAVTGGVLPEWQHEIYRRLQNEWKK